MSDEITPAYWRVSREISGGARRARVICKQAPALSLTEHPLEEARRIMAAANLSPEPLTDQLSLQPPWEPGEVYRGSVSAWSDGLRCELPENDGAIFALVRR